LDAVRINLPVYFHEPLDLLTHRVVVAHVIPRIQQTDVFEDMSVLCDLDAKVFIYQVDKLGIAFDKLVTRKVTLRSNSP
jgi:hypothetical protein